MDAAVDLMGRSGRRGVLHVVGSSMVPTLPPGSVLCVEFSPSGLRRGDLLLFRQADYLVVHRLLGRARAAGGARCLRTRGDGLPALDPALEPSCVVGRVVAIDRGRGWKGVRGRGARLYGTWLAWHDLAWAALVVLARRTVDGLLRRLASGGSIGPRIAAADLWILRRLDRLLFDPLHPSVPDPLVERCDPQDLAGA